MSARRGRRFVFTGSPTPTVLPHFWRDNDEESIAFCLDRYRNAAQVGFDAFYDCIDTYWLDQAIGFVR